MLIPDDVSYLIRALESRGHQAYAVGGCVRDTLLGRKINDWDLCTSALPEEIETAFSHLRVWKTGLKHGTLTVRYHHSSYEITTFRVDGAYQDHRRPESVHFVQDLREDLKRRDFTINAMAADAAGNIIDPFAGQEDLQAGIIRCVGDAHTRFSEDALRILRALRFSAVYNFSVHPDTARAMRELKDTLRLVSAERVWAELSRALMGVGIEKTLLAFRAELGVWLPEILESACAWPAVARAVSLAPKTLDARVALLFLGCPPALRPQAAEQALRSLKTDARIRQNVPLLLSHLESAPAATEIDVLKALNCLGRDNMSALYGMWRAALPALGGDTPEAWSALNQSERIMQKILAEGRCYQISDLAVNGRDLIALGVRRGAEVGNVLKLLLEGVMRGDWPNKRRPLLEAVLTLTGLTESESHN